MYVVLFYKVIHWQLRDQTHVLVTALASFRTVARFFTLRCNTMRRHTKQGRRYKSLGKKLGCLDVKRTSKLLLFFFFCLAKGVLYLSKLFKNDKLGKCLY